MEKKSILFEHHPLDLVDNDDNIFQVNNGGSRRYYETRLGKFVSITSILSAMTDKTHLIEWRKRIGEEEANKITRRAGIKGTALHLMIEHYLRNDPLYESVKGHENRLVRMAFQAMKPILDSRVGKIYAIEKKMFSQKLRVSGTVDFIAEFDGKLSIIDFKTSVKPKKREYIHNYFMQETAYSLMLQDMSKHELIADQLVTLIAVDGRPDIQVMIENRDDWMSNTISIINNYHRRFGMIE